MTFGSGLVLRRVVGNDSLRSRAVHQRRKIPDDAIKAYLAGMRILRHRAEVEVSLQYQHSKKDRIASGESVSAAEGRRLWRHRPV